MISLPKIERFGAHAILMSWEAIISETIHQQVMSVKEYLLSTYGNDIIEIVPTYAELAIYLNPQVSLEKFIQKLTLSNNLDTEKKLQGHRITIPVCYDVQFGWDLKKLATEKGLSIAEVIELHSQNEYSVYFLGFLPGFPYLGGLDESLHTPRLESPRAQIEAGAVAIGGNQTGIYPSNSPGGWNVIGKTPLSLFSSENGSLLKAGDVLRFKPINISEYKTIKERVESGAYLIRKEALND